MNTIIQLLPLVVNLIILVLIIRFVISRIKKRWGIDELKQQSNELLKKMDEMQTGLDEIREKIIKK